VKKLSTNTTRKKAVSAEIHEEAPDPRFTALRENEPVTG
jgi:hypothetical protein